MATNKIKATVINLEQEVPKSGGSPWLMISEKAAAAAMSSERPGLVAGSARSLVGPKVSAGPAFALAAPATGAAILDTIKGRTLVWNHLVNSDTVEVPTISGRKYLTRIGGTSTIITADGTPIAISDAAEDNVFDLTAMFQAGNEPATVAEFEALFPESYYAFNTGTLLPFKGTGLKVTGVNQWDEQWELGTYDTTTGAKKPTTNAIRNKNRIEIIPNTQYFGYHGGSKQAAVFYYDENGIYIGNGTIAGLTPQPFNTPARARYMNFRVLETTYADNICINLSNPAINGKYFPYVENTLSLPIIGKTAKDSNGNPIVPFPEGMNGVGTDYDVARKADGEVKYAVNVELDKLNWTYNSGYGIFFATFPIPAGTPGRLVCDKYATTTLTVTSMPDKSIRATDTNFSSSNRLYIKDSAYTDATTFAASLVGVKLAYPLATPVPFTWDEPLEMVAPVAEGGILFLQPEGVDEQGIPATAPLSADIKWPVNAVSADTLTNLLDALKTAGVITDYTMTWDAAAGAYTFTIS